MELPFIPIWVIIIPLSLMLAITIIKYYIQLHLLSNPTPKIEFNYKDCLNRNEKVWTDT